MKGVLCWNNNSMVIVRSFNASGQSRPMMADIINGTTVIDKTYMNNKLYCSYRRKLAVPLGSEDYMFDLRTNNSYPIWAAGQLNQQGMIAQHNIRIAPPMILDVRFQAQVLNYLFYFHKNLDRHTMTELRWIFLFNKYVSAILDMRKTFKLRKRP